MEEEYKFPEPEKTSIYQFGNSFVVERAGNQPFVCSFEPDSDEETAMALMEALNAVIEELKPYDKWAKTPSNVSVSLIPGHKASPEELEITPEMLNL